MAERTLLQMVNSVSQKLRGGDEITTLVDGGLQIDTWISLINEAARDVLDGYNWSFNIRDDGVAQFMEPATGTMFSYEDIGVTTYYFRNITHSVEPLQLANGNNIVRFLVTDDDIVSNTSFPLSWLFLRSIAGQYECHMNEDWLGETYVWPNVYANWKLFSFEHILPETVGRVISVRNEETPLRLFFEDRNVVFDKWAPRPHDTECHIPTIVVVGGIGDITTCTSGILIPPGGGEPYTYTTPERTGTRMAIWPMPTEPIMLKYTYTYCHPAISADTDVFAGVPENVVHLIEWRAMRLALISTERDADQAAIAARVEAEMLAAAINSDKRAPKRRCIPGTFSAVRQALLNRGETPRPASSL